MRDDSDAVIQRLAARFLGALRQAEESEAAPDAEEPTREADCAGEPSGRPDEPAKGECDA
jgi:hypothetical protein